MRYPRNVEGLIAKHSGKKGYGLFAAKRYAKGELLCATSGARIKGTDSRLTHRGVQIGKNLFIEPKRFSAVWYLNHSCAPNCYVDDGKLYARRSILPGEELTADYSLFIDYPSWDMPCACGEKSCRKVILPFSRLQKNPSEFVSSYLR
ncbi:TPA: SET domain-containing protein [Candidatus Woesearchaeota archaeon]|nr:SET domain-containing protein [Candidatus Woesearchaeota archaeon]